MAIPADPERRHLYAAVLPTAFTLGMALTYVLAWRGLGRWDRGTLLNLSRLTLLQAVLMHAAVFLSVLPYMKTRLAAAGYLAGLAAFYGIFGLTFSLVVKSWMPLVVIGGSFGAEVPRVVFLPKERKGLAEDIPGYAPAYALSGYLLFVFLMLGGAVSSTVPGVGLGVLFKGLKPEADVTGLKPYLVWGAFHHLIQAAYLVGGAVLTRYRRRAWRLVGEHVEAFTPHRKLLEHGLGMIFFGSFALICLVTAFVPADGRAVRWAWLFWGLVFLGIVVASAIAALKHRRALRVG